MKPININTLLRTLDTDDFENEIKVYKSNLHPQYLSNNLRPDRKFRKALESDFYEVEQFCKRKRINSTSQEWSSISRVVMILEETYLYYIGDVFRSPFLKGSFEEFIDSLDRDLNTSFSDELDRLPFQHDIQTPFEYHSLPCIVKSLYGMDSFEELTAIIQSIEGNAVSNPEAASLQLNQAVETVNEFFNDEYFKDDFLFLKKFESSTNEFEDYEDHEQLLLWRISTIQSFITELQRLSNSVKPVFESPLLNQLNYEAVKQSMSKMEVAKVKMDRYISMLIYLYLKTISLSHGQLDLSFSSIQGLLKTLTGSKATYKEEFINYYINMAVVDNIDKQQITKVFCFLEKLSTEYRDLYERIKKTHLIARDRGGCFGQYQNKTFQPLPWDTFSDVFTDYPEQLKLIRKEYQRFMTEGPNYF